MRGSKDNVRARFDKFEWKKGKSGHFVNTSKNEDLRPVSREYNRMTHERVKRYLRENGKYFLDAGCGPIPHKEYLDYSTGYQSRICIDFSLLIGIDMVSIGILPIGFSVILVSSISP